MQSNAVVEMLFKSLCLGLHLSQGRDANRPAWASSMFARLRKRGINVVVSNDQVEARVYM